MISTCSSGVSQKGFQTLPWRRWVGWLILVISGTIASDALAVIRPPVTNSFRSDRVLVKFRETVDEPAQVKARQNVNAKLHRKFTKLGDVQVLQLPRGADVQREVERLRSNPAVEFAEPDFILSAARVPNEPRYFDGSLYFLYNWGQLGGTAGCDIDAAAGWDFATDASSVIVSIMDTGTRVTHEDLAENLWVNPGEIPGNGIDDDGNGYVDDVHGINARDGNGDLTDTFGHGTHVAGIFGAVGNNGIGVVGTAWRARIMTCKFLDNQLQGSVSDALECIEYSRVNGARIINASWGGTTSDVWGSQALYNAIDSLRQHGIIFVAAAGNFALNNDSTPRFYPASFDLDNIIAVAATTRDDEITHFSDYGLESVDLAAPGYIILSTWADDDSSYALDDGTSMSTPQVAAACALAWSLYPTSTYQQIIQRVLNGTDPIPRLAGKCKTGGRLNLYKVLSQPGPLPPTGTQPVLSVRGTEPGKFLFRVTGTPGSSFELQSSSDLEDWSPGKTFQMPESGQLDMSDIVDGEARFYRAVLK